MNRALLLTPPGSAAIAVVRLVGPGVDAFLSAHFSAAAAPGRCIHGTLRDAAREVIDDPVIVLSNDRRSADVNVHGGPWVVRSTLELARQNGFDVIEAPSLPLPAEAVDADSRIERAILASLPLARTELALRVLLAQRSAWRSNARGEQSDERANLHPATLDLRPSPLFWLLHPPTVTLVGVPNVGKSTLANQLFAQERSITADIAGTTRDWVGELADVNGLAVMLVDTPGLRETSDVIESAAIASGRERIGSADLVVLVLDLTQPLEGEQAALLQTYPQALVAINKSDQPAKWELPLRGVIRTVATTGAGIDALRHGITRHFGCDAIDLSRPMRWTERQ